MRYRQNGTEIGTGITGNPRNSMCSIPTVSLSAASMCACKSKKGNIDDVSIFGDFFGVGEVAIVEDSLKGVQYDRESIGTALELVDIPTILGGITKEEFINLIY